MDTMIDRNLQTEIKDLLAQGRSVFLFGPRQTGKTTLLNEISSQYPKVLDYSFLSIPLKLRTEQQPQFIRQEVEATRPDLVIIDEVQKVPEVLDEVQWMIDRFKIVFAITGSSARKLKRKGVNLLAGRAITFHLDPFDISERQRSVPGLKGRDWLEKIVTYGDLPEIALLVQQKKIKLVENLLRSYVETFLEEEVRMETLVRKIGLFGNFLKLAAEMSGKILSFRELSQDIGVGHQTISSFYGILNDCLIIETIPPLLPASSRRRLSKATKFIFFDLGVRNATAGLLSREEITREEWGNRLEQWIGLSLIRYFRSRNIKGSVYYWRDHNGPEIDWVVEWNNRWIPVEVKWTEHPQPKHGTYLNQFIKENPGKASIGYIVFTGDRARQIDKNIIALPWFELYQIFRK
jgi:predicted AAA+ superfamily ATPase